jgi:hypothetical protein
MTYHRDGEPRLGLRSDPYDVERREMRDADRLISAAEAVALHPEIVDDLSAFVQIEDRPHRRYFVVLDLDNVTPTTELSDVALAIERALGHTEPWTNIDTTVYATLDDLTADAVDKAGAFE